MNFWKLGCRWGKKIEGKPLFFDLLIKENIVISWDHLDFGKDSIILLTDGFTPLGIAKTLSHKRPIQELIDKESDFKEKQIYFEEGLMYYKATIIPIQNPTFSYDAQQGIINIHNYEVIKNIQNFMTNFNENIQLQSKSKILEYKKQIILQGPPGTGKTRLAKEIAKSLISSNKINFDDNLIRTSLKTGLIIDSASKKTTYEITKTEESKCLIKGVDSKEYSVSFQSIIEAINSKIWESGNQKNGLDPYKAAIGKYLFENINNLDYSINKHVELIQFHPSYTYEDFVRGITAKNNGGNIEYKTENKIIASFAEEALKNFEDSNKDSESISEELKIEKSFDDFIDHIQDEIDKNGKYFISNLVYINQIDTDAFRYKGDNWASTFRMPFNEVIKLYKLKVFKRKNIKNQETVLGRAKQHATYYFNLLEKFRTFIPPITLIDDQFTVNKNKYVLIIDEINRSNLPSVLGELIYALEYRGKAVQSMYDIDGNSDLILPPNLYIIGTMNTADRSVGHIDYAIRRRFAFVDVLPKNLKAELGTDFDESLFMEVANLFIANYDPSTDYNKELKSIRSEYLNSDFDPKDVWLGHSYFIKQYEKDENGNDIKGNPYDFNMRLDYEIKPILLEYVKDGILKESAKLEIEKLKATI